MNFNKLSQYRTEKKKILFFKNKARLVEELEYCTDTGARRREYCVASRSVMWRWSYVNDLCFLKSITTLGTLNAVWHWLGVIRIWIGTFYLNTQEKKTKKKNKFSHIKWATNSKSKEKQNVEMSLNKHVNNSVRGIIKKKKKDFKWHLVES